MRRWLLAALVVFAAGCAIVPQNRRAHLADPIMTLDDPPLEAYRKQKLYGVRKKSVPS